ncbi:MAG: riboflavin synthase [Patescibacteria group bacterium]|nr:riboflavin synthase [Patescibacteria group bacterium]
MFTGIIQATGRVIASVPAGGLLRVRITMPKSWRMAEGRSIAVDGICSTVTNMGAGWCEVEYMPETLRHTTAKYFKTGSVVNLERSLAMGDALDGHVVQGHVDGRGRVSGIRNDGAHSVVISIVISKLFEKYVALKGSITVNGVSLTVSEKRKNCFSVALIPYTLRATNLGAVRKGDEVNIETDILARYLAETAKT